MMMGGAAVAVAALGYYYYSKPSNQDDIGDATDPMDYSSKIEQITYDGDTNLNPIEEQPKSADNANSFDQNERKTYEEPVEDEQVDDAMDALDDDAEESKEVEEVAVPEVSESPAVEVDAIAEAVAVMESKEKVKEDSPVMVEVEPVEPAQPTPQQIEETRRKKEEAERKLTAARKLNSRLQRYEKVAERVSKLPTLKYKDGKLKIKVLRATKVDKKDLGKKDFSDVFVKAEVPGSHSKQTKIQKDAVNPVWNESFELKVKDVYKDVITLTMMDHDTMVNDTIGEVEVAIIDVIAAKNSMVRNKGFKVKGSKTGCMLYVDVQYVEEADKKKGKK